MEMNLSLVKEIVKGTLRELRGDVVEIRTGDDLVFSNDWALGGLSKRMVRTFAKKLEGRRLAFTEGTVVLVGRGRDYGELGDVGADALVVELAFSGDSSKAFFVTAVLEDGPEAAPSHLVSGDEVAGVTGVVHGDPKGSFELRHARISPKKGR